MRLSELLRAQVIDAAGRDLGPLRDVRLERDDAGSQDAPAYRVVGIVVGNGPLARLAHSWGYAEGRATGPWLLRALTSRAAEQAAFIPAADVVDWGPATVVVSNAPARGSLREGRER